MRIIKIVDGVYIYKGIRFDTRCGGLKIQDGHSDDYKDITQKYIEVYRDLGFIEGCRSVLLDRYTEYLDGIESSIQEEIENKRNSNKYKFLKKLRQYYLNKYNEQRH